MLKFLTIIVDLLTFLAVVSFFCFMYFEALLLGIDKHC